MGVYLLLWGLAPGIIFLHRPKGESLVLAGRWLRRRNDGLGLICRGEGPLAQASVGVIRASLHEHPTCSGCRVSEGPRRQIPSGHDQMWELTCLLSSRRTKEKSGVI